jgi:hypothetical protein
MQGVWGKRAADDSINDEMVKKSLNAIRALGKRELLSLAGKGKAIFADWQSPSTCPARSKDIVVASLWDKSLELQYRQAHFPTFYANDIFVRLSRFVERVAGLERGRDALQS